MKYPDLARELKMLWNTKVIGIPIIVGTHRTSLKNLEKRIGGLEIKERIETVKTTTLLR